MGLLAAALSCSRGASSTTGRRLRHDCRISHAVTGTRSYAVAAKKLMSAPVFDPIAIGSLDLAALLCSRVCHDLISPVGAIVNGIEVMEEDKNEETKTFALDLIKKSAHQASAKLQFCRLAFGAAGSAGAQIELGDAEKVARGLIEDGKTTIVWNLPREFVPKNRAKLLLNMLMVAVGTIPRGGILTIDPAEGGYRVAATGLN